MHTKPFPQGYCDPNDQTCFGPPFFQHPLRSATPEASEDPYLAEVCTQLEAPPTRGSEQHIHFTLGQAMGYLSAKGAEIQLSPQAAYLLANDPQQAARAFAAKIRGWKGKLIIEKRSGETHGEARFDCKTDFKGDVGCSAGVSFKF